VSKKFHWFPFYYLDWLSDSEVAMMTYAEKGLFIDMLSRCFNEGGLPADEKKLVRLFKCDADDLKECVKMFYEKDEKLFNKKLDSIHKDQGKISRDKSKAGKASAKAREAKRLMKSTGVEQVLNPVATEAQQNPTSTEEKSTEEQKDIKDSLSEQSSDVADWLKEADPFYLNLCEWFYNNLKSLNQVKSNINWKTKAWYEGFRLLLTRDGIDYEKEFKPVINYYLKNFGIDYCPIALAPSTVRTKWVQLRNFYKNNNKKPMGSARP